MSKTIDLELTRAEVEVRELEARLRVVPMNDTQLSDALKIALRAKRERLDKLRALHAAANRGGKPADEDGAQAHAAKKPVPVHLGRRAPLKRSVPERSKAKTTN